MQIFEEKFLVVNEVAVELAVIGVRLLCTQKRALLDRGWVMPCLIVDSGLRKASGTRRRQPRALV